MVLYNSTHSVLTNVCMMYSHEYTSIYTRTNTIYSPKNHCKACHVLHHTQLSAHHKMVSIPVMVLCEMKLIMAHVFSTKSVFHPQPLLSCTQQAVGIIYTYKFNPPMLLGAEGVCRGRPPCIDMKNTHCIFYLILYARPHAWLYFRGLVV